MIGFLANLIGLGRISMVDDSAELQRVQITEGAVGTGMTDRITNDVIRVTDFGFASSPPLDAEAVLVRRTGDRAQSIVIATSHRPSRPKGLQPGDSGIYDVRGAKVMLTAQGIEIDAKGKAVTIRNASKVRVEAELLEVTGDVVSRANGTEVSLNGLADAYSKHKHTGVQTGGGISGKTDSPL